MPIIQSAGQLAEIENRSALGLYSRGIPSTSLSLYNQHQASYSTIIRTQPNVRTVISFIARNLAQLGVHLYERASETDRRKVRDHPFVAALRQPNPADRRLTTYRLMHRTVWDICAFDVAFWAVLPVAGLDRPVIIPLSPSRLEIFGHLWPTGFLYTSASGQRREFRPDQVVYFQASHEIDNALWGVSPIESLRRIIAEDDAAGTYREQFWRSGARVSSVIERPVDAPEWSDGSRRRFKSDWDGLYTGDGPGAGGTPILEDGMTLKEAGSADARAAQYIESRKLSREEAAAAYHVDPIWVGIAGAGLSFSSVVERHKALYQDTLGPWVVMLEQDLTWQALPTFETSSAALEDLYVKLNIAEKLRGSLEDQATALFQLTGRPVLEVNEARALLERNEHPAGGGLAIPLNLTVADGEPADLPEPEPPAGASRPALSRGKKAGLPESRHDSLRTQHVAEHVEVLASNFARQRRDVLSRFGAFGPLVEIEEIFDRARWDAELESDLLGASIDLVTDYAGAVAESLNFDGLETDPMLPFLSESARVAAENLNVTTADQLAAALGEEDAREALRHVFEIAETSRAEQSAGTRFTALAAFAAQDTAAQAGRPSKVWNVLSSNSRHPELNGETVPLGEAFSNGLQYPGDLAGGADQTAGCTCLLTFE